MKAFGLDIGSETIKIAKLEKGRSSFNLTAIGMIKNPITDILSASEQDLITLAEAVKKIKSEVKITDRNVIASLPERFVFSQIIEVANMKDNELDQALIYESENLIPKPLSEVNLDWQVIPSPETEKIGKKKIYLVAAPKDIVSKYLKIFALVNLSPIALETETISIVRCINVGFKNTDLILLNFGARSMDIILVKQGTLLVFRSFPTSGETISRLISSSLNIDENVSEEYKKNYGLTDSVEGKIFSIISPVMENTINEIKKVMRYYEEINKNSIKLMIITGGSSMMPGLVEYFAKSLNLEVQIADPLSLFSSSQINPQFKRFSSLFTVSLGLALKGVS